MRQPTIEPQPGLGVSTAFERTLLPGFAEWFIEKVEEVGPDYIVPAETKGARLLDVVMDYAHNRLGTPIRVPVLYRPALAYLNPHELSESRVLILDDAMRTGSNLRLHRRGLAKFGVVDVEAAVCLAARSAETSGLADHYMQADDAAAYRDFLCQMTELITVRGLPPEVDHHVFDLRLPARLPVVWGDLEALLATHGELTVDAPRDEWGRVRGMTLHDPALPGMSSFPATGPVRSEGPCKVRFFPDEAAGLVRVVPVSFPALDLPREALEARSLEAARDWAGEWGAGERVIAELLFAEAAVRNPETMFRALSAFAEVDLVCGLARLLGGAFPNGGVAIDVQRPLTHRLYGPRAGDQLAGEIEAQIEIALRDGALEGTGLPAAEVAPPRFLDNGVVEETSEIAARLRAMHRERRDDLGHEPSERVGRSLPEIAAERGIDRLLVSRCVDFGLGLGTLVPFVDVQPDGEDSWRVERKYRVSEGERDEEGSDDTEVINQEVVEEVVAYAAFFLGRRSRHFAERHLTMPDATKLLAILRPMLAKLGVKFEIEPSVSGLRALVRRGTEKVPVAREDSRAFVVGDEFEVIPTPWFTEHNDARRLRIDGGGVTTALEGALGLIVPLLDGELDEAELDALLGGSAMSTDQALGLSHVQHPLELALDMLEARLNLVARGSDHRRTTSLIGDVEALAGRARTNLSELEADWGAPARQLWLEPIRSEALLLESMAVPGGELGAVYRLPTALVTLVETAAALVDRLDAVSAGRWEEGVEVDVRSATTVRAAANRMRRSLRSLDAGGEDERTAGEATASEPVAAAAVALLRLLGVLRAFSAACASDYRGPRRGERTPQPAEDDRFHTVLLPDIEKSREYARANSFDTNHAWRDAGLNLVAQWGRAFGGLETRDRQGDCAWLEFEQRGDPAVLCAAAIQVHARALRSSGIPRRWWGLRVAVDFGRIRDGDGGNTIGLVIDELNTLAKIVDDDGSIERVVISREAFQSCTPALRAEPHAARLADTVDLSGVEVPPGKGELSAIDVAATIETFATGIEEQAQEALTQLDGTGDTDAPIESVERSSVAGGEAAEGAAG